MRESTTPTQSIGVCCSHKVVAVGFNTLCYDAERRGIKPSARINDVLPFIKYLLGVLLKAYSLCDERFRLIAVKNLTSPERVLAVIQKSLLPLSKKDIMILCPGISQRTVERALNELQTAQKIQHIGKGRATQYVKV